MFNCAPEVEGKGMACMYVNLKCTEKQGRTEKLQDSKLLNTNEKMALNELTN